MKEVLIESKGLNNKGESIRIGRGGGCSALAIPLRDAFRGNQISETIDQ